MDTRKREILLQTIEILIKIIKSRKIYILVYFREKRIYLVKLIIIRHFGELKY